jgi:hypothetical protein
MLHWIHTNQTKIVDNTNAIRTKFDLNLLNWLESETSGHISPVT